MSSNPQDPDLHHAISLRPHPFHQNPPPAHTYLPLTASISNDYHTPTPKKPSASTAVETSPENSDETARQRPVFQSRNSHDEGDVERGNSLPTYSDVNDPYSLRHGLKSDADIEGIRANVGKKRSAATCGVGRSPRDQLKARRLFKFYERQNENIERLLKPVDEHVCGRRKAWAGRGWHG